MENIPGAMIGSKSAILTDDATQHLDRFVVSCPTTINHLLISGDKWRDRDFEAIRKLAHIEKLSIGPCERLSDVGLVHVSKMVNLLELDFTMLMTSRITHRGIKNLSRLQRLEVLRFPLTSLNWRSEEQDAIAFLKDQLPLLVVK